MTVAKMKKQKGKKYCVMKIKLKFGNQKNCLEANQLENDMSHLEKDKIVLNILLKDHKEFIRSNKLILKTHQRFKTEIITSLLKKLMMLL